MSEFFFREGNTQQQMANVVFLLLIKDFNLIRILTVQHRF